MAGTVLSNIIRAQISMFASSLKSWKCSKRKVERLSTVDTRSGVNEIRLKKSQRETPRMSSYLQRLYLQYSNHIFAVLMLRHHTYIHPMLPRFISILPITIISSNFFSDNISRRASLLNEILILKRILILCIFSSGSSFESQIFHYNF